MAACGSAGMPGQASESRPSPNPNPNPNPNPDPNPNQASESMAMPDKMVSGLIGKGGAVIRELMARSGLP